MTQPTTTQTFFSSDRVNSLGDRLVVTEARSDGGELGWMLCASYVRFAGDEPSLTPKLFYTELAAALDTLANGSFHGFSA